MTEACESAILTYLSSSTDATIDDSFPWSESQKLDHLKVVGAIKSLLADGLISSEDITTTFYSLEAEADFILTHGSQEIIVLKALNDRGKLSIADLQTAVGKDIAKIGMANGMKNKWIQKDGGDLVALKGIDEVSDETQSALQALKDRGFAEDALDDKVSVKVRDACRDAHVVQVLPHLYKLRLYKDSSDASLSSSTRESRPESREEHSTARNE
jgi:hypothetical protein